jgi:hypothetical protein
MESRRIVKIVKDAITGTRADAALPCAKLRLVAWSISAWVENKIASSRIAERHMRVIGRISWIDGSAEHLVQDCYTDHTSDNNSQRRSDDNCRNSMRDSSNARGTWSREATPRGAIPPAQ